MLGIKRGDEFIPVTSDTILQIGDKVSFVGAQNQLIMGPQKIGPEIIDADLLDAGVAVVAADPGSSDESARFPASLQRVIAIGQGGVGSERKLIAPGEQILVALPRDQYDMRSGSSLSAAHASGVVALLLSVAPREPVDSLRVILEQSQVDDSLRCIDACVALQLAGAIGCRPRHAVKTQQ